MERKTVLVVDDDEMIRDFMTETVRAMGFEVIEAENGIEGLKKFEADKKEICLVISDVIMPEMDGFEFAKRIKILDPEIPVFLMSGTEGEDFLVKAKSVGAQAVLKKPFRIAEISGLLKKYN